MLSVPRTPLFQDSLSIAVAWIHFSVNVFIGKTVKKSLVLPIMLLPLPSLRSTTCLHEPVDENLYAH